MSSSKPSRASQQENPNEFFERLQKAGKSPVQIVRLMSRARYGISEISQATHLNGQEIASLLEANLATKNGTKADSDGNSEKGAILQNILEGTQGINPNKLRSVVNYYREHEDSCLANPTLLFTALTLAGLSGQRAKDVTSQFLFEVAPDTILPIGPSSMSFPWQQGTAKEREQEQDQFDKSIDRMLKLAQLKMLMNLTAGAGEQVPSNMSMEIEPVLGEKGEPLTDSAGNTIFKKRYTPLAQAQGQGSDGILKAVEIMSAKNGNGNGNGHDDLLSTLVTGILEQSKNETERLEKRLDAMSSFDPVESLTNTTKLLKEAGFVGNAQAETIEVAKVHSDLEKFKAETAIGLEKWKVERDDERGKRGEAVAQMKEFHSTLRTGIEKIGTPLVQSYTEGVKEGRQGQRPGQPRQQENDLASMTDDDLASLVEEGETAERSVRQAQENIQRELAKRRLNRRREEEITP